MSNERNTSGPDDLRDPHVSRAYSELSSERAPEQLNEAVLRQAAKAARPPYKRSILWTRPVAWAAVVAICLAITLQVTQIPTPTDVPELSDWQRDDRATTPEAGRPAAAVADEAAKAERQQTEFHEVAKQSLADSAPAAAQDDASAASRRYAVEHDRAATAPLEASLEEAAAPLPEDYEMQDGELLQRAEDMVRQREGDNKEAEAAAVGVSSFAAPARSAALLEVASCSDEDREDPQDWLACIVLLEQAGRDEEAAAERGQLAETFPDFEMPASPD